MTVGLLTGLLLLAFGTWIPPMGIVLGFFCGGALRISDIIVRAAETIPGGHFWLPAPSFGWLVAFYVIITASIFFFGFGPKLRICLLTFSCVWLCIGTIPALDQTSRPWFFLAEAHRTRRDDNYLYRCRSRDKCFARDARRKQMALRRRQDG